MKNYNKYMDTQASKKRLDALEERKNKLEEK